MNKRQNKRQVYNKKIIDKHNQSQFNANKRQNKKKTVATEIIEEIEGINSEQNDETNKSQVTNQNKEHEEKVEDQEENIEKKKRNIKPRLKLDDKTLLYSEKGMRKYYETIIGTNLNYPNNERNLNNLVNLFKNWHFLLFPNYDLDFFTNKLNDLGKKPSIKAYMSRLRNIYKKEADWDIMYDEQNLILGKGTIMNNEKEIKNPNKKEDNINIINNKGNKAPFNILKKQDQKGEAKINKNNIPVDINNSFTMSNKKNNDVIEMKLEQFDDNEINNINNNNVIMKDINNNENSNDKNILTGTDVPMEIMKEVDDKQKKNIIESDLTVIKKRNFDEMARSEDGELPKEDIKNFISKKLKND